MSDVEYGKALAAHKTSIPGLIVFDIPAHGDNRGWFKENCHREKMMSLGRPDTGPEHNYSSFNRNAGTRRHIHA